MHIVCVVLFLLFVIVIYLSMATGNFFSVKYLACLQLLLGIFIQGKGKGSASGPHYTAPPALTFNKFLATTLHFVEKKL